MTRNREVEIVTTHPGTIHGTADPAADGTVYQFTSGTAGLLVPVTTDPDGTNGTATHGTVHGTGTGTAGQDGSPVPSVPTDRPVMSILHRRNRRTGEPENRGSVTTDVPTPAAMEPTPAATNAGKVKKLRLAGHGHQARTWLTIVVAIVASLGQAQYARAHSFINMIELPVIARWGGWVFGGVDITPWLAVAVFDLAVAALLYSGRVAFKVMGLSPWPFWYAAMGVAGFSVFTNTQHAGGWVTAPASAVLFLLWFLTLLYEYLEWRKDEGHRADATPNLLLSKLVVIDRRLALRAWIIASTRPLARGVAHRRVLGEVVTPRELALVVGRLYLDVYDDQVVTQLRTDRREKKERVRFWQRRLRKAAFSRAVMTASDAVDHYLGLPVIERTGIKPARISYAAAIEEPTPARTAVASARATAPIQRVERPQVPGTVSPVSAPPSRQPVLPARVTAVPDVPESLLEEYADKIALVQRNAGDAWWNGPKPLTVDKVQTEYGVGNRAHATIVARCLAVLRARRLADNEAGSQAPQNITQQGGTA